MKAPETGAPDEVLGLETCRFEPLHSGTHLLCPQHGFQTLNGAIVIASRLCETAPQHHPPVVELFQNTIQCLWKAVMRRGQIVNQNWPPKAATLRTKITINIYGLTMMMMGNFIASGSNDDK